MQTPGLDSFQDILPATEAYSLSDVSLEWPDARTAIFCATLNGPEGLSVWTRAWLSTEAGTLAEAASTQLSAGETVTLIVRLKAPEPQPQFAYMRIESSPLQTEQVVGMKLKRD